MSFGPTVALVPSKEEASLIVIWAVNFNLFAFYLMK